MRTRRRFWTVAALALYFACAAVLLRRPLLFVGTVGIGAWVVGSQYSFTWTVTRLDRQITVDQQITPATGRTTDEFEVTLTVSNASELSRPIDISLQPSPDVTALPEDRQTVRIDPDENRIEATRTFRCPIAGRVTFGPPRVTVTDQFGLFRETVRLGAAASAAVDPSRPTPLPNQIGDELDVTDGDRTARRTDAGLVYRGIREYVPSDPANRIDWHASARLGDLKVVEFQNDADRSVGMVIDRRSSLAAGFDGQTKFDYCREAALSFVDAAADEGNTVSLFAFDEAGPSVTVGPGAGREWYATLRTEIRDLDAPAGPADTDAVSQRAGGDTTAGGHVRRLDGADAATLSNDQSAFGTAVRPFCAGARPDAADRAEGSLTETVLAVRNRLAGDVWTVIFTDDTNPAETRESVRLARETSSQVLLFLTPSSLFEADGISDIEATYRAYREFESFRRELDSLSRVRALEVSPQDRLERVAAADQPATN